MPGGVEDEALIMLGLGEDAGPGLEQCGSIGDRAGDRLVSQSNQTRTMPRVWTAECSIAQGLHTSMLPFAFSRLSTTPSITSLIFRIPSSSLRKAASRASSVSNFDCPGVVFA